MGDKSHALSENPMEAESVTDPVALQEVPTTLALPGRSSYGRWLAVAFIFLGGFWILSERETQREAQETAQMGASRRPLTSNPTTHLDTNEPITRRAQKKEAIAQGRAQLAAQGTPEEEASLELDIQPNTARVYLRAATSTDPFRLISTGSGSTKLPRGLYEIKITDRQKKAHRQELQLSEDQTLRVRLKTAAASPKASPKPTLPE